jgi:predicted nucleic acid-binding protein
MARLFLDTNILLRHVRADHPEHSPRATAYLSQVEQGEIKVWTAVTVIFETVFVLQRLYQQPKVAIRDVLMPLIDLPGIVLPGKRQLREAFDLYIDLNMSFPDAYHVALMKRLRLTEIVSFDHDFDRIPGITRVEPS